MANVSDKPEGQQEPVGVAGAMPGTSGFTMAAFKAGDVPLGTPLYIRPSEQAVTEALKSALETMNRYRRAGHGDDVFMDGLCRSIRKAEAALKAAMEAGG